MRHQKHKHKLGVSPSHRKSLVRNLAIEVIDHGQIKTTRARCKAIRSSVEKLITIAKTDTVANRRRVQAKLQNKEATKKLFTEVAPRFKERPGGYTRILRLPDVRVGDGAKMGIIALVD